MKQNLDLNISFKNMANHQKMTLALLDQSIFTSRIGPRTKGGLYTAMPFSTFVFKRVYIPTEYIVAYPALSVTHVTLVFI